VIVQDSLRCKVVQFKLGAHFRICAACSLRLEVRALISFSCCVLVASFHLWVKGRAVEEIVRNQVKPSPEYGDRVVVFGP